MASAAAPPASHASVLCPPTCTHEPGCIPDMSWTRPSVTQRSSRVPGAGLYHGWSLGNLCLGRRPPGLSLCAEGVVACQALGHCCPCCPWYSQSPCRGTGHHGHPWVGSGSGDSQQGGQQTATRAEGLQTPCHKNAGQDAQLPDGQTPLLGTWLNHSLGTGGCTSRSLACSGVEQCWAEDSWEVGGWG